MQIVQTAHAECETVCCRIGDPSKVLLIARETRALSRARTSLALARQILACVPTLLDTASALLRTSETADRTITAIRDLMK